MSMTMDLIRHIAGLYSGKAIKGDFTQIYITGNEIWMAQQILSSQQAEQHPEQAEGAQEDDYMPTGILEAAMHGYRVDTIGMARAAMAKPSPAHKSDMQRVRDSWEELTLGAHLYRCCVGITCILSQNQEESPEYRELRKAMDDWENGKLSPAPELERPEVTGWLVPISGMYQFFRTEQEAWAERAQYLSSFEPEPIDLEPVPEAQMPVAQHQRIDAARVAEIERLKEELAR